MDMMEFGESGERKLRPEFDPSHPELIFDFAREEEAWRRASANEKYQSESLQELINILEVRIIQYFGSSPELVVSAADVVHTEPIQQEGSTYVIKTAPVALEDEVYGKHDFQGRFQGFHIGDKGEIRVYVSGSEEAQKLKGGIYIPLYSVRLNDSQISLTEYNHKRRLEDIDEYIMMHLEQVSEPGMVLINALKEVLKDSDRGVARRLHDSSQLLVGLERQEQLAESFMDALIEMIQLTLRLDVPLNISASAYREVLSARPSAYRNRPEARVFEKIIPTLGLTGDSQYRSLSLLFFYEETGAIQIPVNYITHVDKSV